MSRAPYACDPAQSRGRFHDEAAQAGEGEDVRSPFQRDRDRVIHSTAFRRLKHKTQVFVSHEGDHFRTRLTHSLEVAQIARTIARALGLDEDLTEALALAHDLGHTPFGHAGERALDACMADHGGFEHNAQTLRIVTRLERRYAAFDGLNLTWETLEGLLKHNGPVLDATGRPAGKFARAGLPAAIREFVHLRALRPETYPSAEAQAAAVADDIAYNAHDIDDGLRAQLFDLIDLADLPLVGPALTAVLKAHGDLERPRLIHETVRRVISRMVGDVIARTRRNAEKYRPQSADDVRRLRRPFVCFSPQMAEDVRVVQRFLRRRMYRHPKVMDAMRRAERIVQDLFAAYISDPDLLPRDWKARALSDETSTFPRQVCDFIAGMTDRYAIEQHRRLFDLDPLFR
jgi:dGTPase